MVILCLFLFLNIRDQAGETQKQDFVSEEIEETDSENSAETKDYDYYQKQLEAKLKELGHEYSVTGDNSIFFTVYLKSERKQTIIIRSRFDEYSGAAIYVIESMIIDIHEKVEEENLLVDKILGKNDESLLDPTIPLGRFYKYTEREILLYENFMSASLIDDLEFFLLDVATVADETEKLFTDKDKY